MPRTLKTINREEAIEHLNRNIYRSLGHQRVSTVLGRGYGTQVHPRWNSLRSPCVEINLVPWRLIMSRIVGRLRVLH